MLVKGDDIMEIIAVLSLIVQVMSFVHDVVTRRQLSPSILFGGLPKPLQGELNSHFENENLMYFTFIRWSDNRSIQIRTGNLHFKRML